jgi:tetratricopeptide (TPR) repeat protein
LRGDIYQRRVEPWSPEFDPAIPLSYYKRAAALNPRSGDAHNELGYMYDVYFDDFPKAEAEFRKAIDLGWDYSSYYGLARVLAETGRLSEALSVLSSKNCPFSEHPKIVDLRREIDDGNPYDIRDP